MVEWFKDHLLKCLAHWIHFRYARCNAIQNILFKCYVILLKYIITFHGVQRVKTACSTCAHTNTCNIIGGHNKKELLRQCASVWFSCMRLQVLIIENYFKWWYDCRTVFLLFCLSARNSKINVLIIDYNVGNRNSWELREIRKKVKCGK